MADETIEVSREFLESVLEELEQAWSVIDGEFGSAEGGLEKAVADGTEPVIAGVRKLLGK